MIMLKINSHSSCGAVICVPYTNEYLVKIIKALMLSTRFLTQIDITTPQEWDDGRIADRISVSAYIY